MARKIKEIIAFDGLDRRKFGYYSTPPEVANYVCDRLFEINPEGSSVVDPCVGMDEFTLPFLSRGLKVAGFDVNDYGGNKACTFYNADFLGLYEHSNPQSGLFNGVCDFSDFDYWIANPPYNCHEVDYIQSRKKHLKEVFQDVGVHNMYSMFMSAMIDLARPGALLGLVVLDSFLTSKAHTDLRAKILKNCVIYDVLLCPTDLFLDQGADVRTCILILKKESPESQSAIRLLNRVKNKSDFFQILKRREFEIVELRDILLDGAADGREFVIGVPSDVCDLFKRPRVGAIFKCITGISTGNDKKYISPIKKEGFSVPFYKNPGSRKFFAEPDGYMIDDYLAEHAKVKNFMVRNVQFLLRPGITCSSMGVEFSACYLPKNSVFGVNPNIICDEASIWWLLAYLNSNLAKYLVRGVLVRTNMLTSGYLARLPLPEFSTATKNRLAELSFDAYELISSGNKLCESILPEINELIYISAGISGKSRGVIEEFCKDIVKLT